MLGPVTLACNRHDMRLVQQAIQQCRRQRRILRCVGDKAGVVGLHAAAPEGMYMSRLARWALKHGNNRDNAVFRRHAVQAQDLELRDDFIGHYG